MIRHRAPVPVLLTLLLVLALPLVPVASAGAAGPEGQVTWGVHITLAPTWLDPAEAPGIITPYMVYYALHDAVLKPMPGKPLAPALAESWSVSPDGATVARVSIDSITPDG